jgi:hypothetical protein
LNGPYDTFQKLILIDEKNFFLLQRD